MRTSVYIDGFNLYFRLLEKKPAFKWLDVVALAKVVLGPQNDINDVRYYTARVSGHIDPQAPARQQIYLDALKSLPQISVHMGSFLTTEKFAGLVRPPQFRPHADMPPPWPDVVKVRKIEEKGSDVNLASHLLLDAFKDRYDVAAVLSNDSDLIEPIRIATAELGKVVGLLTPVAKPTEKLREVSSFIRHIRPQHLRQSQFPEALSRPDGKILRRPESWSLAKTDPED